MIFSFLLVVQQVSAEPFWKAKEKYYQKIKDARAVIVSVRTEPRTGGETLILVGGGHIRAPADFVFAQALKLQNLKDAVEEIQEIREEKGRVFIRGRAYGYEAKMWLVITPVKDERIRFEVVDGTLKGLRGELSLAKFAARTTEIGIHGTYDFVKFPIPKLFAEFGLEVILQRMAIRLRRFFEKRFQAESAVGA